jgi:hypothetical protein
MSSTKASRCTISRINQAECRTLYHYPPSQVTSAHGVSLRLQSAGRVAAPSSLRQPAPIGLIANVDKRQYVTSRNASVTLACPWWSASHAHRPTVVSSILGQKNSYANFWNMYRVTVDMRQHCTDGSFRFCRWRAHTEALSEDSGPEALSTQGQYCALQVSTKS